MANERDYEGDAVLDKWRRRIARTEEVSEAMTRSTRKNLAAALKENNENRRKLAAEFVEHLKGNKGRSKFQGGEAGFNLDGVEDELITGFEPLPWDRDE